MPEDNLKFSERFGSVFPRQNPNLVRFGLPSLKITVNLYRYMSGFFTASIFQLFFLVKNFFVKTVIVRSSFTVPKIFN